MTKEELKQEAEQDAGNASGFDLSTSLMVTKNKTDAYRLGRFDGYLSGAEPREKRITELEAQIEKMKCCGNCTKGNCVNNGQIGKACAYWTSNKIRR